MYWKTTVSTLYKRWGENPNYPELKSIAKCTISPNLTKFIDSSASGFPVWKPCSTVIGDFFLY